MDRSQRGIVGPAHTRSIGIMDISIGVYNNVRLGVVRWRWRGRVLDETVETSLYLGGRCESCVRHRFLREAGPCAAELKQSESASFPLRVNQLFFIAPYHI